MSGTGKPARASKITELCAAALMIPVSAAQSGGLEEWFEQQCILETMSRNQTEKYLNPQPTDRQKKACKSEAYHSAKAFRAADTETKIDLMMRACIRSKSAMWIATLGPAASRREDIVRLISTNAETRSPKRTSG